VYGHLDRGIGVGFTSMSGRRLEDERRSYTKRARERISHREARLRRFGFENYAAYIKSSLWTQTRSRYWCDSDTCKVCGLCGTSEPPLALHHRTYERVGAERLDDLVAICVACHHLIHALEARGDIDGLDADLANLTDPVRAAHYRQQNRSAEVRRSEENDVRRKRALQRLAIAESELASAEAKNRPERVKAARRRLRRIEGKLRWFELHPALSLDPLSMDRRIHEQMQVRPERRPKKAISSKVTGSAASRPPSTA
jgi:hypothetical protein